MEKVLECKNCGNTDEFDYVITTLSYFGGTGKVDGYGNITETAQEVLNIDDFGTEFHSYDINCSKCKEVCLQVTEDDEQKDIFKHLPKQEYFNLIILDDNKEIIRKV